MAVKHLLFEVPYSELVRVCILVKRRSDVASSKLSAGLLFPSYVPIAASTPGLCTIRQEGVIPSIIYLLKTGDIQCVKVGAKSTNVVV